MERDEEHVLPAIPEGSAPIQGAERWLNDIREHHKFVWKRGDFRRNVLTVAELLLERLDYASHTCTPGRDWLLSLVRFGKSTLDRALRWLRSHGFLGLVAGGRKAEYTPRSSDAHARWGNGDAPVADRAVYVLCQPLSDEDRQRAYQEAVAKADNRCRLDGIFSRFHMAVDLNGEPIQKAPKTPPKGIREWASPMLKGHFEAAARVTAALKAARTDLQWPGNKTTSAPDEATRSHNELQAARTVAWRAPGLSKLSHRHLRAILKPYFRAGWTANDVLWALDHRPDGRQWPHDGLTGVMNVAGWLQNRLGAWRMNGQVTYSHYQRMMLDSEEARQRAIAVARRRSQS